MDSIIFDVDGTMWDSTDIVARSWNEYLQNNTSVEACLTAKQLKRLFWQAPAGHCRSAVSFPSQRGTAPPDRRLLSGRARSTSQECAPLYPALKKPWTF